MPAPPSTSPFHKKKFAVLSSIATFASPTYTDNSPKGTIDAEIIDLINEINDFDGYVTTSSCAGRVAVFVEGRAPTTTRTGDHDENGDDNDNDDDVATAATKPAGPGGKGHGNKWLYVSHEPIPIPDRPSTSTWHELFGLTLSTTSSSESESPSTTKYPSNLRLIKLSFSPLILHILCSTLQTARPLLAAAINAGFRESGVQSLKILDDEEKKGEGGTGGVMMAIRTAGCAFETVVGHVEEGNGEEVYRSVVEEGWLGVCVGIVNGRFEANVGRRERLRGEIRGIKRAVDGYGFEGGNGDGDGDGWEDKEVRRLRKREEGLRMKREKEEQKQKLKEGNGEVDEGEDEERNNEVGDDGLADGLFIGET